MTAGFLNARIHEYAPSNAMEQENVLQEIVQYYLLASLSRAGLFSDAIFHGGTCLRILHGMSRFSEDLDFLLKGPDPEFRWGALLESAVSDFAREAIDLEIQEQSAVDKTVRKAYVKTDSFSKAPQPALPFERPNPRKIRVKLEIDTNPPAGSAFRTSYITFPGVAAITTQELPSSFGLKTHALLCRKYVKGRDWYDFVWYVARRIKPDLRLLRNALVQQGPWAGQSLEVTPEWLVDAMGAVIRRIDWKEARSDVQRFVPTAEQPGLDLWDTAFFEYQLDRLKQTLLGR